MSKFIYERGGQSFELKNGFVISLMEYNLQGYYAPIVECAVLGHPSEDVRVFYEHAEMMCLAVFLGGRPDDGFLDIEGEGPILHVSSICVIVDADQHTVTSFGLVGQKQRCGILLQHLYQLQGKPIDTFVQQLMECKRPLSIYDKLRFALDGIALGEAMIYAESDEELQKLSDTLLLKRAGLPPGCTKYYHYYTVTSNGFLNPVKQNNDWDIVYSADKLADMAKQITQDQVIGFSRLAQMAQAQQSAAPSNIFNTKEKK